MELDLTVAGWLLLIAVTFTGALAQSAIGFGYSLLTVPFYLVLLPVEVAIQLGMFLTFAITLMMVVKVASDVPRQDAKTLMLASIVGFPLGLWFFIYADAQLIRLAVAITIIVALLSKLLKKKSQSPSQYDSKLAWGCGVFSGMMVTSLAMAGPALAIYCQFTGAGKNATRSIIFVVFAFSYIVAIFMQSLFVGLKPMSFAAAAWMLPVVILGTFLGDRVSSIVSETVFSRLISGMLIAIALYLLLNVFV